MATGTGPEVSQMARRTAKSRETKTKVTLNVSTRTGKPRDLFRCRPGNGDGYSRTFARAVNNARSPVGVEIKTKGTQVH